jgi:arsenite/tail-anchored protein-transporting ATPase
MFVPTSATRNMLFTGKGGVGKTSLACATALELADQGKRVLLVSTDPASNLDEVLEAKIGLTPALIPGTTTLKAVNIDPEEAARAYKERVVGPYRELLPESALASIEEQLSGACTIEIAAIDEFTKLLGDPHTTSNFDHVIFDTAPTGHTLRLLQLPSAWTDFIEKNNSGTSCLGPLAGLTAQREVYEQTVSALRDGSNTTVYLVSRPEDTSLAEADRTRGELEVLGIMNQRLIVNGIFKAEDQQDPVAIALQERGLKALSAMPGGLRKLNQIEVPLVGRSLIGVGELRRFANPSDRSSGRVASRPDITIPPPLNTLLPEIARSGRGVIMTMGKGGVGKTTVAREIAVALASMGHTVHLTTTDPAAHIINAVERTIPNLHVGRIDPAREVQEYCAEVMADAGKDLDDNGRALLEEDLRSPCTEEIAVFRAFARTVNEGNNGFVVIDTAPTGHTLLLLDAANAYHRDVERNLTYIPESVKRLLPQLRDKQFTKILIVALAEATPVHEAAELQQDLRRAGIHPFAWVINQSFLASGTKDPVLAERGRIEARYINEVQREHAERVVLIPWKADYRPDADISMELATAGVKHD